MFWNIGPSYLVNGPQMQMGTNWSIDVFRRTFNWLATKEDFYTLQDYGDTSRLWVFSSFLLSFFLSFFLLSFSTLILFPFIFISTCLYSHISFFQLFFLLYVFHLKPSTFVFQFFGCFFKSEKVSLFSIFLVKRLRRALLNIFCFCLLILESEFRIMKTF